MIELVLYAFRYGLLSTFWSTGCCVSFTSRVYVVVIMTSIVVLERRVFSRAERLSGVMSQMVSPETGMVRTWMSSRSEDLMSRSILKFLLSHGKKGGKIEKMDGKSAKRAKKRT